MLWLLSSSAILTAVPGASTVTVVPSVGWARVSGMTEERAAPDQHDDRVVDDLTGKFAGIHRREVTVADTRADLGATARVVSYLPVLTGKLAHDRLAQGGATASAAGTETP